MKNLLYLASGSASRQSLLNAARIPFELIKQNADESVIDVSRDLNIVVQDLAQLKMRFVALPPVQEGATIYIVTADTLTRDMQGGTHGKPSDRDEAKVMLRSCRSGAVVGSGFCITKWQVRQGHWAQVDQHLGYGEAFCVVDIPEPFLDFYLDRVPFTNVSGGITIEGFGEQFVREVRGSYSSIIGLPMYDLRHALYNLGFYSTML